MAKKWDVFPSTTLRVGPDFRLDAFDAAATPGFSGDEKDASKIMAKHANALSDLQERLFADGRAGGTTSVLLVLQGMDTSGKGGIVRHVVGMVDPQGVQHRAFGKPTKEELAHHYLWRIRNALPVAGKIGVFDRSHYEDVLIVRVHNLVPGSPWAERYAEINAFEAEVAAAGTRIIKCAMLISPDEQKRRLGERLERPDKYWKFNPGDIDERAYWNEYQAVYQDMFDATSTDVAPWYAVPADNKWFARLVVGSLLFETLTKLNLGWPAADFDVEEQKRRLEDLRL
ncbi:MAG: polyphosphate kinase 2 family protein [Demequina sp.]|jgi:PPK2 family polyphosphate:nucleotide phosphotransferase|nr:polyphosphate kinase 2 family protein [Demequina sp.]